MLRTQNTSQLVFTVPEILSARECCEYISLTESVGYAEAPITTAGGFVMRPDIRNNGRVMLNDVGLARELWKRVANLVPKTLDGMSSVGLNERFRFYRYEPGQYFAPHFDGCFQRNPTEKSLLTFMVYLNDGFIGGETNFPDVTGRNSSVVPVGGMGFFFYHYLLHEGAAVIRGRKYVLRTDVMYWA